MYPYIITLQREVKHFQPSARLQDERCWSENIPELDLPIEERQEHTKLMRTETAQNKPQCVLRDEVDIMKCEQ